MNWKCDPKCQVNLHWCGITEAIHVYEMLHGKLKDLYQFSQKNIEQLVASHIRLLFEPTMLFKC